MRKRKRVRERGSGSGSERKRERKKEREGLSVLRRLRETVDDCSVRRKFGFRYGRHSVEQTTDRGGGVRDQWLNDGQGKLTREPGYRASKVPL